MLRRRGFPEVRATVAGRAFKPLAARCPRRLGFPRRALARAIYLVAAVDESSASLLASAYLLDASDDTHVSALIDQARQTYGLAPEWRGNRPELLFDCPSGHRLTSDVDVKSFCDNPSEHRLLEAAVVLFTPPKRKVGLFACWPSH